MRCVGKRTIVSLLCAALLAPALGQTAEAADYPSHPIRLVVPYAPGGGADAVARIVAKKVGESIGQAIVIDNKGGAGAIVGTEIVAKAEPDGYTLLLGQSGPISINPAVYKSLPYDPVKDFAPVTMTTSYPYILVVNADLPAKTLQEFVALARSKPGTMNYGSTGVGAANHLVAELFNSKAGLKMTHIPYRGTALAVADLVAGQLTMVFGDPVSVLPHIKSGKLRALAVTTQQRSPVAPDVPTVAESGYPGFDAIAWHGILAPARTPPAIVDRLSQEIAKALNDPETKALLANQAMQPVGNSPADFAAFIQKDIATWKAVAQAAHVTVE
ncbi:Tripartite-type tricarboxylate transporter, receptor component TctC [Enhydrobacter aerosaccus]|uniref:Tripartite-type tricarboxylate transporter, receptor component TctC n=1 Tax=Enhydrobacter aerosaccus TaxID=225324 RepID=A0A1T4T5R5_9HYPH|nr:tripartite tricarboxylate transporter substrate binding protein [Enhydrobacter aerosaccus]SKA35825.1 Tripartite-type tricarboxylate transporter, receptor component TctC [Enhydrobacter aerosaccus]